MTKILLDKIKLETIKALDGEGKNMLYRIVKSGNKKAADLVINKMNEQEISHTLIKATKEGDQQVISGLFEMINSKIIEATDEIGRTALHWAVLHGHKEVVELLLGKMNPKSISITDKDGKTALHLAASNGNESVVSKLLAVKPELARLVDKNGQTASQLARDKIIKNKLFVIEEEQKKLAEELNTCQEKNKNEKTLSAEEQTVKEIFGLIAEGNDRIQGESDKAILLLGKTGAGKSTLAHLLGGKQLKAVYDNDEDEMLIEAVDSVKDIVISHKMVSETKIPGKQQANELTIWDCPGFFDTAGVEQEIANSFYITRLFETSKKMKFVLVTTQESFKRSGDIVEIVTQLARTFKSVSDLEKHLSLVVTRCSVSKKAEHIVNSLKKILEQNSNISIEAKQIFKYLIESNSIYTFPTPKKEGVIKNAPDLLAAIEQTSSYKEGKKDKEGKVNLKDVPNIAISDKSMAYMEELLITVSNNISNLLKISKEAVNHANNCLSFHDQNNFMLSIAEINNWLPKEMNYISASSLKTHAKNEYFLQLNQLAALKNVFQQQEVLGIEKIFSALQIFEEYALNSTLKEYIQAHAYFLKQQLEYSKFLSEVKAANSTLNSDSTKTNKEHSSAAVIRAKEQAEETAKECSNVIEQALKKGIMQMQLIEINDVSYYKLALFYLEQYSSEPVSGKLKSKAYEHLGRIEEQQGKDKEALLFYAQAIKSDETLSFIYEKMGDLLFKHAKYKEAISCYKAVYNSTKVLSCYKEILRIKPKDAELKIEQGDYLLSINYDKVTKHYHQAFSMTNSLELKAQAWNKISERLSKKGEIEKAKEFTSRAESKNFIKSNEIDLIKITQVAENISIITITDNKNSSSSSEVDEQKAVKDEAKINDKLNNQLNELAKKIVILQSTINEDKEKIAKLEENVAIITEHSKKNDEIIKYQESLFERLEQIVANPSNSTNVSGLSSSQNQTGQNSEHHDTPPMGANQSDADVYN